jgi:hypothetical protein
VQPISNFVGIAISVGRGVNVPVTRSIRDDFVVFKDEPAVGPQIFFYVFLKPV